MPSPAPTPGSPLQPLLDLAAVFITLDWDELLALFPIFLAILFVAWFTLTARPYATRAPTPGAPARGPPPAAAREVQRLTPPDVHMPGGSSAPVVVALGAGLLFPGVIVESMAI